MLVASGDCLKPRTVNVNNVNTDTLAHHTVHASVFKQLFEVRVAVATQSVQYPM